MIDEIHPRSGLLSDRGPSNTTTSHLLTSWVVNAGRMLLPLLSAAPVDSDRPVTSLSSSSSSSSLTPPLYATPAVTTAATVTTELPSIKPPELAFELKPQSTPSQLDCPKQEMAPYTPDVSTPVLVDSRRSQKAQEKSSSPSSPVSNASTSDAATAPRQSARLQKLRVNPSQSTSFLGTSSGPSSPTPSSPGSVGYVHETRSTKSRPLPQAVEPLTLEQLSQDCVITEDFLITVEATERALRRCIEFAPPPPPLPPNSTVELNRAVTELQPVSVPSFHELTSFASEDEDDDVNVDQLDDDAEFTDDDTFERRHRKHEVGEKRRKNRDRERLMHQAYIQQLEEERRRYLELNDRLPAKRQRDADAPGSQNERRKHASNYFSDGETSLLDDTQALPTLKRVRTLPGVEPQSPPPSQPSSSSSLSLSPKAERLKPATHTKVSSKTHQKQNEPSKKLHVRRGLSVFEWFTKTLLTDIASEDFSLSSDLFPTREPS